MAITRKKLQGNQMRNEREVLEVRIEPGMKEGTKIRFSGAGDDIPMPGVVAGDVIMVLQEKEGFSIFSILKNSS